ncbi:MAG: hypothetical protein LBD59_09740 [Prevotellaceae bacterium]|nr:hypothetical protein [Prevotellaceae bacterium]
MKLKFLFVSIMLLSLYGASGYHYDEYQPVFMDRENLEKSVFYLETDRELNNPGKIYCLGNYIFVNEKYKGVHVYNNTNPENPVKQGFIFAPGCIDMAVKDSILYLDNSVDLVAFDLATRQPVKRIINVFPEPLSPSGDHHWGNRPANHILIEWRKR